MLTPLMAVACAQAGVGEGVKGTVLSAFYWGYGISQARHPAPAQLCLVAAAGLGGAGYPAAVTTTLARRGSEQAAFM